MRDSRIPKVAARILIVLILATSAVAQVSAPVEPVLGPAPRAPFDLSRVPATGPRKLDATEPLSVNTDSREQVRQFYNTIYPVSEGVPMDSSAAIASCDAGTNSPAFLNAVLLRINWFRAMSGVPAGVTFSESENAEDQSAALMVSANNELQHDDIPTNFTCYTSAGANVSAISDLAMGIDGPDAITGYIQDSGAVNYDAGHRRWLLYPQTQVMATGDVPAQAPYPAANATCIYDSNYGHVRPATPFPYVAWPPPGYAPNPVVFPQWSFALSNADLSAASVTMQSNGVPLSVVVQPYETGKGENTVVWYPSKLDWTNYATVFPFNGADTVYAVTINNAGTIYNYSVTVFDPAKPGADYVPTLISGTNRPSVNENNPYSCTPSANPNTTGFQWVTSQSTNGNLADNALNGLTNFTISPPAPYPVITNPPVGSGKCFHLTHTNALPQLLEFTEILFPATNTKLSFQSLLGYATTNEVARVQFSTNGGGAWVDLYAQKGTGGAGQAAFAAHTLSLSNCAGQITSVRFDYDYTGGSYYSQISPDIGWCLEHIVITNASKLVNFATNVTASTNFNFVPAETGKWMLETRGIIFNQFGLDWSPATPLTVVTNTAPTLILLGSLVITPEQAEIPFTVLQGAATSFKLLQAGQITGPWTNPAEVSLNTLVTGSLFQFTAPLAGATTFYRVLAQ